MRKSRFHRFTSLHTDSGGHAEARTSADRHGQARTGTDRHGQARTSRTSRHKTDKTPGPNVLAHQRHER
eukprot:2739770-Prymnesium_polylepis.1